MLIIDKPRLTFDVETTGLNTESDRIVQIAAIKRYSTGKVEEKNYLINPTIPINPDATEIHGITDEMVADKPTFKQLASSMLEWFRGSNLIGFNSDSFDCSILMAEMKREGLDFLDWDCNLVDVMKLYRKFYPNTQEAIYERFFGESLEGAHDALNDCRASDRILDKLLEDHFPEDVTAKEIDELLQDNKKRVDIAGKMYEDEEGIVRWNFSKNVGQPVLSDFGFIGWFMKNDFPQQSKDKLKELQQKPNKHE